ncbi:hypothetical protein K431DRAFT_74184 [Polychaeton citri CBS 116435]|uniref:WAC domain-containing protein n=1 Tax=Polychaeton citri CBS 116435 TaxID=1314669 RepID=A0A9P4QAG8_9PEZI|nr:hypothetical protein K431DRAFT_74184 [Polychaeton citri CBS 116435]
MVLHKRKPVHYQPAPQGIADNETVWVLQATGEVFRDYEEYLKRYDYLAQKKFTDAINGKSGLTYFQALESELKSSTSIESLFPEVLRDPILRKVQFSTTSRIDDLVSTVFEEFKKEFFPGEDVLIILDDGETLEGVIREKAKFPMIRGPDGSVQRPAFSRYFVKIDVSDNEALLDDRHIRRKRNVFTKQNLRSFLKSSLQREAWIGAPWLVKEHLAIHYRLPMEIPQHLLRDAQILSKQQTLQRNPTVKARAPRPKHLSPEELQLQQAQFAKGHARQNNVPHNQINGHLPIGNPRAPPQPPPPPPIKYPIEDLDLPIRGDMPESKRPRLDFFTTEQEHYILKGRRINMHDIEMASMGMLLEVWNTLNVQAEVYVLDSFTFDDFVDALRHKDPDNPCELLEEVFCGVLKHIVDEEGKVHVKLPEVADDSEDDSDDENDESHLSTPAHDVPAGRTRSRLSHVDPAVTNPRTSSTVANRAMEMLGDTDWQSRLQARDFENGGWQVVLVGLLHQLSHSPIHKNRCERLLAELAPVEEEPTAETAQESFAALDVNLRISALELITMLSVSTKALKDFLEACSDDQTDIRKTKIEWQRSKKELGEQLLEKDREYKILLPENMAVSPGPMVQEPEQTNGDSEVRDASISSEDPDDDAPRRSLRGGQDRKRKREEEIGKAARAKAEKLEREKNKPKQSKEFIKLVKEREDLKKRIGDLEAKIDECDSDLREANVQRTKVLGKDRYCNRYYWFERNGQPFGGLPSSSTAHYGYANGRIWVQGPDQMEVDGFIALNDQEQKEYKLRFGKTVVERRAEEEGPTSLANAFEWGFIDDEQRLAQLIQWLDDKGERERALKKELLAWHVKIGEYMKALRDFKDAQAAKKVEAEEEQPTSRISTRNKLAEVRADARDRCTKWENGMARDEIGSPHSRPSLAAPKRGAKKDKSRTSTASAADVAGKKGVAVLLNRQGKPVSRQGGSYSFK